MSANAPAHASEPAPGSVRFRGFPWWLPLCTAAVALLAALAVLGTAEAEWEAGVRIWLRDDSRPAEDYAALARGSGALETAAQFAGEGWSAARIQETLNIAIEGATMVVTVRAPSEWQARALAAHVADGAVGEALFEYGSDGLEVLGPVGEGARRISPRAPEWAGLAAGAGLLGGLMLAAALAGRRSDRPSAIALAGRSGLRPIAVLTGDHAYGGAPESALRLADEIERSADNGSGQDADEIATGATGTITLFAAVAGADPAPAAAQAARALAGRGRHAVWIDLRTPTPTVRRLHGVPRSEPQQPPKPRFGSRRAPADDASPSAAPLEPAPQAVLGAPDPAALGSAPTWLAGTPAPMLSRAERAAALLESNAARFAHVVAIADPRDLPSPINARAILVADATDLDFDQRLAETAAAIRARGFAIAGAALNATNLEAEELREVSQPPN